MVDARTKDQEVTQVFVHPIGASDVSYPCLATKLGWKCGKCVRGNLGFEPKTGDRCRVCHANVSHVNRGPTPVQWRMPSGVYY